MVPTADRPVRAHNGRYACLAFGCRLWPYMRLTPAVALGTGSNVAYESRGRGKCAQRRYLVVQIAGHQFMVTINSRNLGTGSLLLLAIFKARHHPRREYKTAHSSVLLTSH